MLGRYCGVIVGASALLAGCSTPDAGPVQYGPTLTLDSPSPTAARAPGEPIRLQTATPGIIVAPAGSNAMCQLGAAAARNTGAAQIRYALVGKDCAAPVGTPIENADDRALLGTVAAVITGRNGAWSAVAVRLEPGVGWSSSAPSAVAREGDTVDVMGIGESFRVHAGPDGLLNLAGFSSPYGRSGAAVVNTDHRLVALTAGTGAAAIPVADVINAADATPGLDGIGLV